MKHYSVIVRDPSSWNASTGLHRELANCGHKHRSIETAARCLRRSLRHLRNGSPPTVWYGAHVEDDENERINVFRDRQGVRRYAD